MTRENLSKHRNFLLPPIINLLVWSTMSRPHFPHRFNTLLHTVTNSHCLQKSCPLQLLFTCLQRSIIYTYCSITPSRLGLYHRWRIYTIFRKILLFTRAVTSLFHSSRYLVLAHYHWESLLAYTSKPWSHSWSWPDLLHHQPLFLPSLMDISRFRAVIHSAATIKAILLLRFKYGHFVEVSLNCF